MNEHIQSCVVKAVGPTGFQGGHQVLLVPLVNLALLVCLLLPPPLWVEAARQSEQLLCLSTLQMLAA